MLCFPNCKINLGLYVTSKRNDGFHDLETVFYPVSWKDVLEIVPATETKLHTTGLQIQGSNESNLVLKAYELMRSRYTGRISPLDIFLHKVIPMGAGLGGGSADGAFMLQLINNYYKLELTRPQLAELALQLGSDCPFFIYNTPQFAAGRGEQMSDIALDISGYSLQLICPQVHVSTGAAFQMVTPKPAAFDLRRLSALRVEEWKDNISNDFEEAVFKQHPVLAEVKQQLYNEGAIYASMSGSGSAVYGIFPKGKKAEVKVNVPFSEFYE